MPHDRNGNIVEVGNIVMVPCRIKAIHLTEDYCNVDLQTVETMPPSHARSELSLNARQTVKPWPNEHGDHVVYQPPKASEGQP